MRIFWLIAIEAFLLSIVFAKTEDPNRLEDFTTQEPIPGQNVNSSAEENLVNDFQQNGDLEKPRNTRHIQSIASPIFPENHWSSLGTPIFFEPSLQDKEKNKLVLIEPFYRMKKEEKGFWGWLKKIFGDNKEKKNEGQGPLIGPVKVPGMGDNVYIRAMDSLENEANHVVIHLMMKNSPEKEIKFESHLPLVSFDAVHELPVESASFQTIVSPHYSHEGLFDKTHFPVVDTSWSSVSPSTIHLNSEKGNFFASPTFFRKHSTDNEGSEFSGALPKDGTQQFTAWMQPQQYSSPPESYENIQNGQSPIYNLEENQRFSSAREDISNLQMSQTSGLELSDKKESLPLYPPLFNGSFGQNNLNNKNEIYVTNSREAGNLKSSSGPKRESSPYPGLGAYKSDFRIISLPKNISYPNIEEEYISNAGIQEVEAPNLSQAENRGTYQFSEIENIDDESNSNIESTKKIRNSHSSDYGNYGLTDSENLEKSQEDSVSKLNETDESLKTISASYPWKYKISKDNSDVSKPEEDNKKVLLDSQQENRNSSLSKISVDDTKKKVRNDSRFRNRIRSRNRGIEIKNKKTANQTLEINSEQENKTTENDLPKNGEKESILAREKEEVEKPITAEKVKEFFLKESKRFEEVLKTVEGESEAIEEEIKSTKNSESSKDTKELKITEESKVDEKESKSEKSKDIQESKVHGKEVETEKLKNEESKPKEITKGVKEESMSVEEESKAIKEELNAVKEDLKAVREELKVSRLKSKSIIKESKTTAEEKSKESNSENLKESISEEVNLKSENIPLEQLFNAKEKLNQEKLPEIKKPEENEKLNHKIYVVTPESRITNKTRSDLRLRKSNKKSNSTIRFELKKPKFSIADSRFKNKLQNGTNIVKSNSTVKTESSKPTPPSHISRIYAKNRSLDKLKYKAKKVKIVESEENKKTENESKETSKVEKPKVRISKFSPRIRNFKPKGDTKIALTSDEVKS